MKICFISMLQKYYLVNQNIYILNQNHHNPITPVFEIVISHQWLANPWLHNVIQIRYEQKLFFIDNLQLFSPSFSVIPSSIPIPISDTTYFLIKFLHKDQHLFIFRTWFLYLYSYLVHSLHFLLDILMHLVKKLTHYKILMVAIFEIPVVGNYNTPLFSFCLGGLQ
jgi:hypothetical protein